MKRFVVIYEEANGVMMPGEILAECQEHAEEICDENGWILGDEIPDLFQVGTTH